MMQATLMNFGDNTRVVYDVRNRPCVVDIGKTLELDIADVHFHMIKSAIATDTLMIVPKESQISPELEAILDILKSIETEPYASLLEKFNVVAREMREEHGDIPLQPGRHVIRRLLRDLAKFQVAKALNMTPKVTIKEQGDAAIRQQQEQRDAENRDQPPASPTPETAPASEPAPSGSNRKRK